MSDEHEATRLELITLGERLTRMTRRDRRYSVALAHLLLAVAALEAVQL